MGPPPIVRRRDTLQRCPGELSGIGTLPQAGTELSMQHQESLNLGKKEENTNHYITQL